MIQHLSYPEGESINDGIDRSYCTVHYASFDEAVKLVVEVGKGAFMAKADVESALRLLPVHPRDFCLLGMKVNDFYPVDKSLPMGASCSQALFEKFSTFLEWATKRAANSDKISHFADDFIFVGLEDKASPLPCQNLVETFHQVCKNLGAIGQGKICRANFKIGISRFGNRLHQTSGIDTRDKNQCHYTED